MNGVEPQNLFNSSSYMVSHWVSVSTGFCLAVFLLLALLGNCVSLLVLSKLSRTRTANDVFIGFLCITSLLFAVLALPLEIISFFQNNWILGEGPACVFYGFFKFFNTGITANLLGLLAFHRLMFVRYSRVYRCFSSLVFAHLQVIIVALLTLLTLLPTILAQWGRFGFDADLQTCTVVPVDGRSSKQALFVIGFLMPSLVICLCYSVIVVVLVRSRRRLNSHITITAGSTRNKLCTGEERHVAILGAALFIVFVLCYIPSIVIKVLDAKNQKPDVHVIGDITVYSALWINPILYIAMNRQYRKVLRQVCSFRKQSVSGVPNSKQISAVLAHKCPPLSTAAPVINVKSVSVKCNCIDTIQRSNDQSALSAEDADQHTNMLNSDDIP